MTPLLSVIMMIGGAMAAGICITIAYYKSRPAPNVRIVQCEFQDAHLGRWREYHYYMADSEVKLNLN